MAGVKGRSGGARPNSGPKPREPRVLQQALATDDPKEFLRSVMQDEAADGKLRVDAAKALLPFEHRKPGEGKEKPAGNVTKFTPKVPPKLVANSR